MVDLLPPILCAPLLHIVDSRLVEVLRSLAPQDWDRPTIVPGWQVRDVAAHLLDTVLRKLSLVRDGWVVDKPEIRSHADVVQLVNRLNREGVAVYRRFSPALLCEWMETACLQSAVFHESLDPYAPAVFPVSWAGEAESLNWFDTARELTERWHHQQQIREAVHCPDLYDRELYHPVLDCFLRGLPHQYRDVAAWSGCRIQLRVTGDAGGLWELRRDGDAWRLVLPKPDKADTKITIPQEVAWKIFTKAMPLAGARAVVGIEGNADLALAALQLTAIVA